MISTRAKNDKIISQVRKLGIQKFLSKPYEETDLLDNINKLLSDRGSAKEADKTK
jgi:FixJ family two-component response regulator